MPNVERAGRVDPRCISCDSRCLAGGARGKHTSHSLQRREVSGRRHGQVSAADVCTTHSPTYAPVDRVSR